jgi:hypothetical protein
MHDRLFLGTLQKMDVMHHLKWATMHLPSLLGMVQPDETEGIYVF